ncbi:MAG: sigma-54 dependent transcriptional regulator [Archangium sp.]
MTMHLAVVEDDTIQAEMLAATLRGEGYEVTTWPDGQAALEAIEGGANVDVVLTDVTMPRLDGLKLCEALRLSKPGLPVIVITAESKVETAVGALRVGAWDFLSKPVEPALLLPCVKRAVEKQRLVKELERATKESVSQSDSGLFGQSQAMQSVRALIARVAGSGASVLIHGETGTGKELVARALHAQSQRSSAPFVAINCAALPASLVESELFGYARGAFTDARSARQGLFVEANGGTLFLDEVAELSLDNQAKLLRALQERTVRPLGSNAEVPFDARILAATHRNLEAEVEAGRFRQDLFFRLNVIHINLPPLRDRSVDILHLATHMLRTICERDGRKAMAIPHDVAQKLLAYPWPGNVRELENCVERLAALGGEIISLGDLPDAIRQHERERFSVRLEAAEEIVTLDEMEKRYVLRVLTLVKENRARAAQMLGIDRRTLYRRLEGWGLPTERSDRAHIAAVPPVAPSEAKAG